MGYLNSMGKGRHGSIVRQTVISIIAVNAHVHGARNAGINGGLLGLPARLVLHDNLLAGLPVT
ncbi:MAG TPA: hypothetical protein IAA15_06720 [Candidatus Olsenella pullicola]|nr:hypothetical protein [Candidatus Olsenella pullicola]